MEAVLLVLLLILVIVNIGVLDFRSKNNINSIKTELLSELQKNQESQINVLTKSNEAQCNQLIQMMNMQNSTVNELLKSNSEIQVKINETIFNSLKEIQTANENKLNQIEMTVNEKLDKTLNDRLDSNFKQIGSQLNALYKTLGELNTLSTGVTDLNKTLSNVKTRGNWGELQLKAILEETMTKSQYDANVSTKAGSSDKVEFAIKIPTSEDDTSSMYLPIDSKMPSDIYRRLITATEEADPTAVKAATKELEQRIKTEAKTIRDKYLDPPNTTDFAILFLPTESLYAEVLRIDGLMEWCQTSCKIMIAGPSTITALLNSLRLGFSNLALNKKSKDVLKLLQAIKTQYSKLSELIDKTQKKISDAASATEALKSRTDMIQKKMSKIAELDFSESNNLLEIENTDC